jgi:hypothetical protein
MRFCNNSTLMPLLKDMRAPVLTRDSWAPNKIPCTAQESTHPPSTHTQSLQGAAGGTCPCIPLLCTCLGNVPAEGPGQQVLHHHAICSNMRGLLH